jgi:Uma2 family endonuclease
VSTVSFRAGDLTFEDFLEIIPDGQKADLLDGVIYMASPDNAFANELNTWLCALLTSFVDAKELGTVYVSRVAYRIGPKRGPEPDLGFVSTRRESTRRRGYIDGPPDLAIEIVSPDSVQRDYIQKRAIYEHGGVGEYWIIDPDEQRATFLCLDRKKFKERKPVRSIFRSRAVPDFWIDVRWLWARPRPKLHDVLGKLLYSGP